MAEPIEINPTPIVVNFTHKRGDTFDWTFTLTDKGTGDPIDLGVGATARMTFKLDAEDVSAVLEWDSVTGGTPPISISPAAGIISILGPATDMDPVWDEALYEIEVTHGDGRVRTYFEGCFRLTRQIAT